MSIFADFSTIQTEEVVTTIYVNGFPDDFREREFQNLFTFAKGYEGCSLRIPVPENDLNGSPLLKCFSNVPKGQILGFAKFRTVQDAIDACNVLNGRIVDADRGATLKAELAKKNLILGNLKSKIQDGIFGPCLTRRSSVPTATTVYQTTKCSNCSGCEPTSSGVRSLNLTLPGQSTPVPIVAPNSLRGTVGELEPNRQSIFSGSSFKSNSTPGSTSVTPVPAVLNSGGLAFFAENPPCNTLYVGNLPPSANESELRTIFNGTLGFRRMSFKPKIGGSPMCFVEFDDIKSATSAMEALYGTMLSNSTKGGIRLSYSKNPLGVRSGPPLSTYLGSLYSDLFSPLPDGGFLTDINNSNMTCLINTPVSPGSH